MNRPLSTLAITLVLALLASCAPSQWHWEATVTRGELEVVSDLPIRRLEVRSEDGQLIGVRRLPAPLKEVRWQLGLPKTGGLEVSVESHRGRQTAHLPQSDEEGHFDLLVEAPLGQERRSISGGETLYFPAVEGLGNQIGIQLLARSSGPISVHICEREFQLTARIPGELLLVTAPVSSGTDCAVSVSAPGRLTEFTLHPDVLELEVARNSVRVERIVFPSDPRGEPDPGRHEGRLTLPSPALERVLRGSRLGVRSRAMESPWGYQAIHIRNSSGKGLNAVIRTTVIGPEGNPAPAFRSRVRRADTSDGSVSALIRIPAGGLQVATLPLFVDTTMLPPGSSEWTRVVELIPVGSDASLLESESPVYVSRASSWTAAGFVAVIASMLLGFALLLVRLGPWLRRAATSELVTIALFANLMFLFSAASHVLGLSVTSVLGPFATLITGLVDDVFRYALLATLVTLLPRPGVVTLALLVHTVMRTLALGGFHPALPFLLGSTVLWLEGCLWIAGLTRGDGTWRDERPTRRWIRLSIGFAPPAVVNGAVGLVTAAVLYRLYYADWYVVLMLAIPGFLYTILACRLALGFADSLRKVEA